MRRANLLLAGFTLVTSVGAASATPIELTQAQFTAATAGLPTVVETFNEFPTGITVASPLTLINGTYTASSPVIDQLPLIACPNASNCLSNESIAGDRSFSAFPVNTDFWGTDLAGRNANDVFQVTVVGGDGTAVFTQSIAGAGGFFGFSDAAGLTSVTFTNLGVNGGMGNYGFDNVTTVTTAEVVPEPSTIALLSSGLLGLGLILYRRRASY